MYTYQTRPDFGKLSVVSLVDGGICSICLCGEWDLPGDRTAELERVLKFIAQFEWTELRISFEYLKTFDGNALTTDFWAIMLSASEMVAQRPAGKLRLRCVSRRQIKFIEGVKTLSRLVPCIETEPPIS